MGFRAISTAITCAAVLGSAAWADEPKFSGSVELVLTSGRMAGVNKTRDRFTRVTGNVEWGDWKLTASYWDYIYCGWIDLDETNIQYSKGHHTIKVGRFIVPLGQANWYEQWYSGFTTLPKLESNWYAGRALSERTSPGAQWDIQLDSKQLLQLCIFGSDPNYQRPGWKKLDRGVARYQVYAGNLILGLSALSDKNGRSEKARAIDARWSKDAVTLKGTWIDYSNPKGKAKGMFLDVLFRPKGSDNLTLVGRIERFQTTGKKTTNFDTYTAGAKVRLPLQIVASVNFTTGPGTKNLMIGGGWSLSLSRVFRF